METYLNMKLLALAGLLAVVFIPLAHSSTSPCRGNQYWHAAREACVNCSGCKEPGHIVLRPCQVHQDALCGPLHALNIDWSWLGHRYASNNTASHSKHHSHQHQHKKHGHSSQWSSSEKTSSSSSFSSGAQRRYHKHSHHENKFNISKQHNNHHHPHHHHHKKLKPPESAAQLKEVDVGAIVSGESNPSMSVALPLDAQRQQQEPFTTTETLVWDWQAVVLAMAVLACILFFVAAAVYGVQQARRDAFRTADIEDLSAHLSLMVPGSNSDSLDNSAAAVEGCNTNHCLYMEQLLVRKQQDEPGEGKGNVYIDRDNTNSPRV